MPLQLMLLVDIHLVALLSSKDKQISELVKTVYSKEYSEYPIDLS
jgi:hypothetical protein